jgi:hypothetical protein
MPIVGKINYLGENYVLCRHNRACDKIPIKLKNLYDEIYYF